MTITGFCGHRNLSRLEVKLLPARDLFAGLPGRISIRVTNRQRYLPVYLLRISVAGSHLLLAALDADGSAVVELPLQLPKRGLQPAPEIQVSSCFPVNFFVRFRQFDLDRSLLVFPHPLAAPFSVHSDSLRATSALQTGVPGGDGDLRSIETYRPGDPPKAIHWKLSARHQELKTKQLNRQAGTTVILDPEQLSGSLEERLSRCTYLINRCFRQNYAVGLRVGKKQISPAMGRGHQLRLLKELALYE